MEADMDAITRRLKAQGSPSALRGLALSNAV